MVRAVVGAFEAHVDAVGGRPRLRRARREQGAGPAGGRDGVVAPRFTGREWSHLEAAVAGAFEGDGSLDGRQGSEVVERQGGRVLDGAADLRACRVCGQGEVAADVVEARWA